MFEKNFYSEREHKSKDFAQIRKENERIEYTRVGKMKGVFCSH